MISVGFSAWHIGQGDAGKEFGYLNASADDLQKDYSLADLGITCGGAASFCETIKYSGKDANGVVKENDFLLNNRIGFSLNVPLVRNNGEKSIQTIDCSSYYLKFTIGCSKVVTNGGVDNTTAINPSNLFSSFTLYPSNFPNDSYVAKSTNDSSNSFYFPLKTYGEMSLYQLSRINQSYSSVTTDNSTSLIICSFVFDKEKAINNGLFLDNVAIKYSITIGLSYYGD